MESYPCSFTWLQWSNLGHQASAASALASEPLPSAGFGFWEGFTLVPIVAAPVYTQQRWIGLFSTSLPAFLVTCLNDSHPDWEETESPSSFNLHFSEGWTPLKICYGHLYFFWKLFSSLDLLLMGSFRLGVYFFVVLYTFQVSIHCLKSTWQRFPCPIL